MELKIVLNEDKDMWYASFDTLFSITSRVGRGSELFFALNDLNSQYIHGELNCTEHNQYRMLRKVIESVKP